MYTIQSLDILSTSNSDEKLIKKIILFSEESSNWKLLEERTKSYAKNLNQPACIISFSSENEENIGFAFASRNPNQGVYLISIIPERSEFNQREYNKHLSKFVFAFKKYLKGTDFECRLKVGKENLELEDIITAPKTRKLFEFYLKQFPRSKHSLDIRRLDNFICAFHQYNAQINLEDLTDYLIEDLNWSVEDAEWCINRIITGLDILRAKQIFH